jgi:hypothetical protein
MAEPTGNAPGALAAAVLAAVVALTWFVSGERQLLGAVPLLLGSAAVFVRPPRPARLRAVGWMFAAATLLSGAVLLWST